MFFVRPRFAPIPVSFQKTLLAALSGLLLALSYPPYNLYLLQWIAFVPLLTVIEDADGRTAYLLGTVTGFVGIAIGFHWVGEWARIVLEFPLPINHIATVLYSFAAAQVFGFIFFLFQILRADLRPVEIFLFPTLFVSIFSAAPILFRFTLGDAQSYFTAATQTIEFTGVYGLDCLLLLTNIFVYRVFFCPLDRPNFAIVCISLSIVLLWFGIGFYRLEVWDRKTAGWAVKRIGLVQTNRNATLHPSAPRAPYSRTFPKEIALSRMLLPEKPEIIVWPEGNFFGYSFWSEVPDAFRFHIAEMAVPVLFHDITRRYTGGRNRTYNSTILIDETGSFQDQYDKMIRVPFGEYVPLTERFPFIKRLLEELLGDFMTNLGKGERHKTFISAGMKLVPIICYESLFPEFVAESIRQSPKGKVLVVQSQDGWYGKTGASEQHLTSSALRAIENRVPLVHVINNGRSGIVLPTGRYVFISDFFREGQWVVEMPYDSDSGGSFYSRYPYLFVYAIRFCLILFVFPFCYKGIKKRFAF